VKVETRSRLTHNASSSWSAYALTIHDHQGAQEGVWP